MVALCPLGWVSGAPSGPAGGWRCQVGTAVLGQFWPRRNVWSLGVRRMRWQQPVFQGRALWGTRRCSARPSQWQAPAGQRGPVVLPAPGGPGRLTPHLRSSARETCIVPAHVSPCLKLPERLLLVQSVV